MDSPPPAIEVAGLEKRFGDVEAVRGVDFRVETGETFGFLGPNGAGKSTTINILCTLARATAGTARVAGHDVATERDEVRRSIGLVFQDPTLDSDLTAEQNLRFHAELYGVPRAVLDQRIDDMLRMVGLTERRGSVVQTFSGGMKRRLEIARGLLHSPRVLFLDEPTIGLDPQSRASVWDYIRALREREDITVFLTTHYMDEAEHCDRIAIMDAGRIVALDTPEALKAAVGKDRVQITTADDEAAIGALRARFGIEAGMHSGAVTFAVADGERFVPRLFAELGVSIRSVSVSSPSLDDVFLAHTGTTIRDAESTAADRIPAMFRAGRR
ncbi:MAG TPA: ATP-binding cassette domain-containing protein [Mycobacteriales bacterium]|jgi:ABC-2 type transport system ATP-binding protein|nr:ATP-binding cassette domain-containing protein [Mycobacteriales bacterium]